VLGDGAGGGGARATSNGEKTKERRDFFFFHSQMSIDAVDECWYGDAGRLAVPVPAQCMPLKLKCSESLHCIDISGNSASYGCMQLQCMHA
jgi:hypothetical protein